MNLTLKLRIFIKNIYNLRCGISKNHLAKDDLIKGTYYHYFKFHRFRLSIDKSDSDSVSQDKFYIYIL